MFLNKGGMVNKSDNYQLRKQLMWGLLLIGFGAAVYLDREGIFEFENMWHYWPLGLTVIGINKMIGYPTARDFCSGLWLACLGAWLFANFEHLWGMTFQNSWPLLIIAGGVTMVLQPMLARRFEQDKENQHGQS